MAGLKPVQIFVRPYQTVFSFQLQQRKIVMDVSFTSHVIPQLLQRIIITFTKCYKVQVKQRVHGIQG